MLHVRTTGTCVLQECSVLFHSSFSFLVATMHFFLYWKQEVQLSAFYAFGLIGSMDKQTNKKNIRCWKYMHLGARLASVLVVIYIFLSRRAAAAAAGTVSISTLPLIKFLSVVLIEFQSESSTKLLLNNNLTETVQHCTRWACRPPVCLNACITDVSTCLSQHTHVYKLLDGNSLEDLEDFHRIPVLVLRFK